MARVQTKTTPRALETARLLLPAGGFSGQITVVDESNQDLPISSDVIVAASPSMARHRFVDLVDFQTPEYRTVGVHSLSDGCTMMELHRVNGIKRVVDVVFEEAAGGTNLRFSSRGDLVADYGKNHLLRISIDESPNTWALRTLKDKPYTPQLVAWGQELDAFWAIEEKLTGRNPRFIGKRVADELVRYCATLPRQEIPPIAHMEDIEELKQKLPGYESTWDRAEDLIDSGIVEWSVARHGDIGPRNLLRRRGHLSGIVGWDRWHAFSVPGADLMNLFAPQRSREIGRRFRTHFWNSKSFRKHTEVYWGSFRIEIDNTVLMAAAAAWWLAELAGTLMRSPELTREHHWVFDNVDAVAAML